MRNEKWEMINENDLFLGPVLISARRETGRTLCLRLGTFLERGLFWNVTVQSIRPTLEGIFVSGVFLSRDKGAS